MSDDLNADRALAARVAAKAEIVDVRLLGSQFSLDRFPAGPGGLAWELDVRPDVDHDSTTGTFVVTVDYTLKVVEMTSEDSQEAITSLQFSMAALYELADGEMEALQSHELEAFARTTGVFALYPYARAYVQDVTARLGLPPLTLSVLRIPVGA